MRLAPCKNNSMAAPATVIAKNDILPLPLVQNWEGENISNSQETCLQRFIARICLRGVWQMLLD